MLSLWFIIGQDSLGRGRSSTQCFWLKQHPEEHLSKGVSWTFCQNACGWGRKYVWNVLLLLNCPLGNWRCLKGVGGEEGQLFRPRTTRGAPLIIPGYFSESVHLFCFLTIRYIRTPGNWLLLPHACCETPLGVAHSHLISKELRNNFFSECGMAGCGKWHGS